VLASYRINVAYNVVLLKDKTLNNRYRACRVLKVLKESNSREELYFYLNSAALGLSYAFIVLIKMFNYLIATNATFIYVVNK
jgi:hypothetical protein